MEMLIDVFTDAAIDCIKMLPFLFLAFLLIEALEHYSSDFTKKLMIKVDKAGPVVGAVVGCVPQCGFSVMAANLSSGGIITIGTLIAVFLATSNSYYYGKSGACRQDWYIASGESDHCDRCRISGGYFL